jgi:hypothetical protein
MPALSSSSQTAPPNAPIRESPRSTTVATTLETVRSDDPQPVEPLADAGRGASRCPLGGEQQPVLNRPGGPVGCLGQQLDVRVAEGPLGAAADQGDADHAGLDDERHTDEGADTLLGPARTEGLELRGVGDHRGRHRRGDRAGEALPDRDPHADDAVHRHAVARHHAQDAVLDQQELGNVGRHDLAEAGEQLVQEAVGGQAGEPRVPQCGLAPQRCLRRLRHRLLSCWGPSRPLGHDRSRGAPVERPAAAA